MIRWLLGLCEHKWTLIDTLRSVNPENDITSAYIYVQRCENCGKIKKKTMRGVCT